VKKLVAALVGVAVAVAACVAVAHAQTDPTVVVAPTQSAPSTEGGWPATVGTVSLAAAAIAAVNRFLTVLERMVTDTRAWLDRVLDVTKGRLKVDWRKTIVNTWSEDDPDRTGPIRMNRRRDDPGRNGTHEDQ
jgi:hypothetical protein